MKKENNRIQLNEITPEAKKSTKVRVISSLVGLLILIPCLIIGDWLFLAFIIFLLLVAVIEIIKCDKQNYSKWCYVCTFLICFSLTCWPIFRYCIENRAALDMSHVYSSFNSLYLSIVVLVIGVFALFYIIMWDGNFTVKDACFIFTMGVLISLGFQAILFIRYIPLQGYKATSYLDFKNTFGSISLICYLIIAVFATDIGAYFTGMLFGKKKINPRISPKKTWAGFWGGLIISSCLSFGFGMILAATNNAMLQIFDMNHWYNILMLSLLIPPFATLGDFVFSAIKRYFGIKDFGNIMPGHGGVLDRCDSIIFSSLVMACYIVIAISIDTGAAINPLL